MSIINQNLLLTPEGYQISRSVRLRSSANAYLNRTFGTPTSSSTWTFSCWLKRGGGIGAGVSMGIFAADTSEFYFASDKFQYYRQGALAAASTAVYRDPSAWYHIVVNSNGSTVNAYVNNQSSFTYSGTAPQYNTAIAHNIGRYAGASDYFDGYITEFNFIDGQALTPSSFGETDAITGVWKPKRYAGTYGTNGFYLNFSDNSAATAAAIGKDSSGNGNNWTPNNISVTAGATYDSMLDVPTPYADGGNGRGNYAILNPLSRSTPTGSSFPVSANLTFYNATTASWAEIIASIGVYSGKWYWEITCSNLDPSNNLMLGVVTDSEFSNLNTSNRYVGSTSAGYGYYSYNGNKYNGGSATAYGGAYVTNDVVGVALDMSAGTVTFYKNNVSQGTAFSGLTGTIYPAFSSVGGIGDVNFGQRPFTYTPPTGFKALNTQNLPDSTIKKGNQYFDVSVWSGDGNYPRSITGLQFQPDLFWQKTRNIGTDDHLLADSVRGVGTTKWLSSNLTAAEGGYSNNANLVSLDAAGFTIGSTGGTNVLNAVGRNGVAWQWKKGATQGFDIVTYTGNSANRTIAHSLGVAPSMVIVKNRSAVYDWPVYHAVNGATKYMYLNTTSAAAVASSLWNDTAPTSSVFSVGTSGAVNNSSQNYVAYLFSEVAGFSKFGSYTGNGSSDGPFVFTGMKPRFLLIKRSDAGAEHWNMFDTARKQYNLNDGLLYSNLSNAETNSGFGLDFLSNGFKPRDNGSGYNTSGATYIYAAFAENPFKNSLAR